MAVFLFSAPTLFGAGETNSPDPLSSSLVPPRGEIPPTFWELYGLWVVLLSVLLLVLIAFLVWLATRPKPVAPIPWSVRARRELQALRQQPPNGDVLSRVGQVLRCQIASAFGLPPGESTTPEFRRALSGSQHIGPELSEEIVNFLSDCDRRKFAPTPPPVGPWDPFVRALSIIEKAEKRLAALQTATAATSSSCASPRPERQPSLASGG